MNFDEATLAIFLGLAAALAAGMARYWKPFWKKALATIGNQLERTITKDQYHISLQAWAMLFGVAIVWFADDLSFFQMIGMNPPSQLGWNILDLAIGGLFISLPNEMIHFLVDAARDIIKSYVKAKAPK